MFTRIVNAMMLVLFFTCVSACYKSDYIPPDDGRARIIWHSHGHMLGIAAPSVAIPDTCVDEIKFAIRRSRNPTTVRNGVFWIPRYFGAAASSTLLNDQYLYKTKTYPRYSPYATRYFLKIYQASGSSISQTPIIVREPIVARDIWDIFGSDSNSGWNLSSDPRAAIVAVIVIGGIVVGILGTTVAFFHSPFGLVSIIEHPWRSGPQESKDISIVNAYNDLARTVGSACAYEPIIGDIR